MHANGLSLYCPFVPAIVRLQDKKKYDAPARKRLRTYPVLPLRPTKRFPVGRKQPALPATKPSSRWILHGKHGQVQSLWWQKAWARRTRWQLWYYGSCNSHCYRRSFGYLMGLEIAGGYRLPQRFDFLKVLGMSGTCCNLLNEHQWNISWAKFPGQQHGQVPLTCLLVILSLIHWLALGSLICW